VVPESRDRSSGRRHHALDLGERPVRQ
jgi:hypothetical protein